MSAILKEPALEIRPLQDEDLQQVIEIERQSYPHPWTQIIFGDCLQAGYSCWVCGRRGIIEAYGVLSVAVGESHLLNICVSPGCQGMGVGRRLLQRVLRIAGEREADTMFLEVRESNIGACGLYESEGFGEIGRRRNYYPKDSGGHEDALVYAKAIL